MDIKLSQPTLFIENPYESFPNRKKSVEIVDQHSVCDSSIEVLIRRDKIYSMQDSLNFFLVVVFTLEYRRDIEWS